MKRLLLLGVLSCSIALRADDGAGDLAFADDAGVSDAGELLKPIDDAVALPVVESAEMVVALPEVVIKPEVSVNSNDDLVALMQTFADEYQNKEDDVASSYEQPALVLDEEHALAMQQAMQEIFEQEEVEIQAADNITTLIEYQCLDDLLKTEPHKSGKAIIALKRIVRAGLGVATSAGLGHLIKTRASTWADAHSLPLHAGLGILACGLYEALLFAWQDNQDLYRSILGHIVQNWNIYTMLVPEDYVDTFSALHATYVQNGNQLTVTEKEAKNIVKTMKYGVRSEIKKRQPQSYMHDKKR